MKALGFTGDLRPRRKRLYRGWWIVATGYLCQLASTGASGWIFGVLIAPMQQSLGWRRTEIVGVLTLSSFIGGVLSVRLGPAADRRGTRLLITGSAFLAGACLIANSVVTAKWQFYLAWAGFGLSMPGISTIGPNVAIANWFIRRRSVAFTFYTLGSATAGILLAPVFAQIAVTSGWRSAWIVLGLLTWVIVPFAWLSIRHRPEDVGLLPDGDEIEWEPAAASKAPMVAVRVVREDSWTVAEALHTRSFWLLTAGFMLASLPASSIFIHMSAYMSTKGFTVRQAATAVSIYGVGVLIGRFIWGFAIVKLGMYRSLVGFGFTYGLGIVLFMLPSALTAIYAMTILLGISIAGSQQLQSQSFSDYFGRKAVGSLLGYAGLFFMVSRSCAPLFAAFVYDATRSYTISFTSFIVACVIASLAFLIATPPKHGDPVMDLAVETTG